MVEHLGWRISSIPCVVGCLGVGFKGGFESGHGSGHAGVPMVVTMRGLAVALGVRLAVVWVEVPASLTKPLAKRHNPFGVGYRYWA